MTTVNNTTLAAIQLSQVIEQLEQLLFCDLVMTYNDYAEVNHYERIFDNDEDNLNNIFLTPYDVIMQTNHKDYNENDDYFVFNGYGHAVSFSYQLVQDDNCPIDIEELAQWIVDNELFNDYDIEVTTLDDMLASIEDNITDDEHLLKTAINYLGVSTMTDEGARGMTYNDWLISEVMAKIRYTNYETIKGVIDRLGINYE